MTWALENNLSPLAVPCRLACFLANKDRAAVATMLKSMNGEGLTPMELAKSLDNIKPFIHFLEDKLEEISPIANRSQKSFLICFASGNNSFLILDKETNCSLRTIVHIIQLKQLSIVNSVPLIYNYLSVKEMESKSK